MKHRIKTYAVWVTVVIALTGAEASGKNIRTSKHNLSLGGPGTIKAASETEVCIFCHTIKRSRKDVPFLWNRKSGIVNYKPYTSSTLSSIVGQPTGASRVCLSCHDGTIALGAVLSRKGEMPFKGGVRFIPPQRKALLGTDLSDDHPVSFSYEGGIVFKKDEIVSPALLPPEVKLDETRQLQCTTCHDPHDDTHGNFLVMSNRNSALCTVCHKMDGWSMSTHATSNSRWNGRGKNPWAENEFQTVAENGCENCHRPHSAGRHERLLKYEFEEDNCLACHNGNVSLVNVENELIKRYRHAVQDYVGVHDAAEDFYSRNVPKHIECEDCHNPHQSKAQSPGKSGGVSGATSGVTGVNSSGQQVPNSMALYEICYKCHADNNVKNRAPITRQINQLNTRLEFDLGNPSFHPLLAPGMNTNVPSLLPTFSTKSIISCVDCHNNDNLSGPKGPHGSNYEFLLERKYATSDKTKENSESYALCYKCHSRGSILSDQSFKGHKLHVVENNTPCSVCHDPHGISSTQGNAINHSHLINFDLTVVLPNSQGRLYFEDLGLFRGQCYLTCHGREHGPAQYP